MNWNDFITSGRAAFAGLMSDPAAIGEGFINLVRDELGLLPPALSAVAEARASVCAVCPIRRGNICAAYHRLRREGADCYVHGCGCKLAAKTRTPHHACPAHKWPPVDEEGRPLPYPPDPPHNPCKNR